MAGNTKLVGYSTKTNGVRLERWGVQADFELPAESIAELDRVCRNVLPLRPNTEQPTDSAAGFDKRTGFVVLQLDPRRAAAVERFLNQDRDGPKKLQESDKLIDSVHRGLRVALEERNRWFSEDEPGVD